MDISMCADNECPVRETCYRFKAKPSEYRQSYGEFDRLNNPGIAEGSCSYYWKIIEKDTWSEVDPMTI